MTLNTICVWTSKYLPIWIYSLTSKQVYPTLSLLKAEHLVSHLSKPSPFSVNNNLIWCFSTITLEVIPSFSVLSLAFNTSSNHTICFSLLKFTWYLTTSHSILCPLDGIYCPFFFFSTPIGLFSIPKQEWPSINKTHQLFPLHSLPVTFCPIG